MRARATPLLSRAATALYAVRMHCRRRRSSRARGLGVALGLAVLAASGWGAAATPPPDFTGSLRPGLPLRAWFDAERRRGFFRVGDSTSRIYRAYDVALGDLDGDGTREVLVGIWSTTRRHAEPEPHRTVWVLAWDPARAELVEVWRGSALARPLLGFTVRNDRLVATERLRDRCFSTTYDWTGFGFAARGSRAIACEGR